MSKHLLMARPQPPSPRPRLRAEERREAILSAARRVFGGAGYHEATTKDIAAAAGVSEALLYQHFPGKRQLFEELINTATGDLERRLQAARQAADPKAAAVAAYFDFVEAESELYRVFFRETLQMDPAFRAQYIELSQRFVHLLDHGRPASNLVVHALAGMITELALWWVEERALTKEEMIARAGRLAGAICETEE
jgi:AcrR family transcriptional regulator